MNPYLFVLALRSAWNRRLALGLMALAIALAVTMLLGVERLRAQARSGFARAVSGADLVVGARTSEEQLMLYAVMRLGAATHDIGWDSYQTIARHPAVAWTIPLSLGDSHRGFPVLGTSAAYFEHFRYGSKQPLRLAQGRRFDGLYETVLGAQVAQRLGLRLGQRITLSHGAAAAAMSEHPDRRFIVTGILAPTGTPVDRTVHVSLAALEAIHGEEGARAPRRISAALVGLHSRAAVFRVQRAINQYPGEALLAVLPGVALARLWEVVGVVEQALLAVSAMVVLCGLTGLVAVLMAGWSERRRELAVLRAVGARGRDIFALSMCESLALTSAGALAGVILLNLASALAAPLIQQRFGVVVEAPLMAAGEWVLLAAVLGAGVLAGLGPAWRACRVALADGLAARV